MILPDVNLLLYAVNSASEQHRAAGRALKDGFAAPRGVGFAWVALLAFLRLSTRRGIFPAPLSIEDALRVVEHWLSQPNAQLVQESDAHLQVLGRLLGATGASGNLTTDAHLAALAIEHDATIHSFDRDFARFADVKWSLPAALD
ncbi:MAG: type II toxin-antitoxin system VapC family toxin [Steroidobacteraceae bacterium]